MSQSSSLFEREEAVRAVELLIRNLSEGRGGAVFVLGEAGLGKTAVLEKAARRAAPIARVGLGRADPMEVSVPFGLFTQAAADLEVRDVIEQPRSQQSAVDVRAERFYGALRWLEDQTNRPLLFAFDDLQWADPDSLALIFFLSRRIAALPVAIVGTLRPWPPAAEETVLRLVEGGHAVLERLAPLSERGASQLLSDRTGSRVEEQTVTQAWKLSSGNPFLLEQVAAALRRGDRVPDSPAASQLRIPEALLLSRFSGLPASAVRLAQAASVFGLRCLPEVAVEVAGLDDADSDAALESLHRSGLMRSTGEGSLEFAHALLATAVYHDLPPSMRARLHARAFRALVRRRMEAGAAEHAISGNLLGDADALRVLEETGRRALRMGAVATAVKQLEAAVELASGAAAPPLSITLGEALLASGRVEEAAALYERVLARPELSTLMRSEALRMLGRALFLTRRFSEAARRFGQAAELAEGQDQQAVVLALLDQTRAVWATSGPARSLPIARRAREIAARAAPALTVRAQAAFGFIAYIAGDAGGLQEAASATAALEVDPLPDLSDLWWSWDSARDLGRMAKFAERFSEAERISTRALQFAERHHIPPAVASLATYHAELLVRLGRLDEALVLLERAGQLADLAPLAQPMAASVQALALLLRGRLEESEECCRAVEAAVSGSQWLPLLRIWHVRGWRCLVDGDVRAARQLYARLLAASEELGIGEPCVVAWARHGMIALLQGGDASAAELLLEHLEASAHALPCLWPKLALASARAEIAQLQGDLTAADEHLRSALALSRRVELPLDRYQSLLAYGSFLRRSGQPAPARRLLSEAVDLAEGLGARWLVDQAREELRVAGGRRRRGRDLDRLTSQEERVAHLAALGLSNQEIAGRLSVSVKTIETHLLRVYSKLGISSRRQLMLAAPRPTGLGAGSQGPLAGKDQENH